MAQNPASPPFTSPEGKPVSPKGGASGSHDFVKEPSSGGGRGPGMVAKDRPQSEAKAEVVPNQQEIPKGGKDLKADPMPVSAKVSGTALGSQFKAPFKGMKG